MVLRAALHHFGGLYIHETCFAAQLYKVLQDLADTLPHDP